MNVVWSFWSQSTTSVVAQTQLHASTMALLLGVSTSCAEIHEDFVIKSRSKNRIWILNDQLAFGDCFNVCGFSIYGFSLLQVWNMMEHIRALRTEYFLNVVVEWIADLESTCFISVIVWWKRKKHAYTFLSGILCMYSLKENCFPCFSLSS